MPKIVLDRNGTRRMTLQRQMREQIAAQIQSGAIGRGAQLPSTRLLAKLLRVSRNTVMAVYDDLAADGLICSERGTGMRVSSRAATPSFKLERLLREARFPARSLVMEDPDGNGVLLNY